MGIVEFLRDHKWRIGLSSLWLSLGLFAFLGGKRFLFWLIERAGAGDGAPAHLARRLLSEDVRPLFEAVFFPVSGWLVWLAGSLAICLFLCQAFIVGVIEAEVRAMGAEREERVEERWRKEREAMEAEHKKLEALAKWRLVEAEKEHKLAEEARVAATSAKVEAEAALSRIERRIRDEGARVAQEAIKAHKDSHLIETMRKDQWLEEKSEQIKVRDRKIRELTDTLIDNYGMPSKEAEELAKIPF